MASLGINAVRIFHTVFGKFYTARNPVEFWSRWNPCKVEISLRLYRRLRKHVNFSLKIPFTIFIFVLWGFIDDIIWTLIELVIGSELFTFGFWITFLTIQALVVIVWKQLSGWLPRLPSILAIPATQIYVIGSLLIINKYIS